MKTDETSFVTLDSLSCGVGSVPVEKIEVEISTDALFGDYAKAFIEEAQRVNFNRFRTINLTEEDMEKYIWYLVSERVKFVHQNCPDWRKLKILYIPAWIQYNLRMIGLVEIREYGLLIDPIIKVPEDKEITFEQAHEISKKLGAMERDMQIFDDAMPRSPKGDVDVMTTALISKYIRSIHPVTHVASTYVSAFMGMKIKEEAAFKVLYRIQYDDIDYIRQALTAERQIYA